MLERLFRVLDYLMPVATALEFAHLERNACHRDVKPANVLLRLPSPRLRGSRFAVKLADFNVGKTADDGDLTMTRIYVVPGTMFFQSPEQETGVLELLVNVERGDTEIEYFEDFYTDIDRNDTFQLFNRDEVYGIVAADRSASGSSSTGPTPSPTRPTSAPRWSRRWADRPTSTRSARCSTT